MGFPGGSESKESAYNAGDLGFYPWVGKIPWRREQISTPVFWPGEVHGLHSPWGHKESDMTVTFTFTFFFFLMGIEVHSTIGADLTREICLYLGFFFTLMAG